MASRWLWSVCGLLVACSGDADGTLPGDAGASSAGAGGGPATVDAGTEPGLELRVEELGQSPVAWAAQTWRQFEAILERIVPYRRDELLRLLTEQRERPYDRPN